MIYSPGTRNNQISEPHTDDALRQAHNENPQRLEMPRLRQLYGVSAKWWVIGAAFRSMRDSVYPLRWLPSGPNSVMVHGAATSVMAAVMATLLDSGIRGEVLAADPALGSVQVLVDAGWACIGIRPFMRRCATTDELRASGAESLSGPVPNGAVVCLTEPADLKVAGQIVADAFGRDPDPVVGAAPVGHNGTSERLVWGLYQDGELVSCATTVRVGDTVVLWDVATKPGCQRVGYGRTLLDVVHTRCVKSWNARQFLLSSSDAGYPLYESLGYETLGWWQAWSRRRWAFPAS